MFNTIMFVILFVLVLGILLCGVMRIKNEVTYKNCVIILNAIHKYNINMMETYDLDKLIPFSEMKSYNRVFYNLFDWGYKNIVPKDVYPLIEPFIEKG